MILVDLFHQKSENNKVQRCVCEMAELSAEVREYLSRDLGLVRQSCDLPCSLAAAAGTEVGLLWPWLVSISSVASPQAKMTLIRALSPSLLQIVASEAQVEGDHREKLMDFVRRCRWKGAAAPRLAQEIVEKVWDARSRDDKSSSTWRLVLKQLGSPIII